MIYFREYGTYCILFATLLFANLGFGKQPDIRFINLQKEDGLSSNSINDIVKDHLGFMWIASSDGLFRYDAHNKVQFFSSDKEDPNKLQTNNIRSLLNDSKGNLWIGTRLGGLTRYHILSDTWTTFQHNPDDNTSLSNNEILTIIEDRKGRIWIGTENGLNIFNPETETFTTFKVDISTPSSLQGKAILDITEDHRGFIWIGTWAGGLHLFLPNEQDLANSTFRNILPSTNKGSHNVWKVYQDQDYRMWLGTHGAGLFLMQFPDSISNVRGQQNWLPTFHHYEFAGDQLQYLSNNELQDIYQDKDKNLWIGTANGLNFVCANDLSKVAKKDSKSDFTPLNFYKYFSLNKVSHSITDNSILKIHQDDQSLIWFGTSSGISLYNWQIHQFDIITLQLKDPIENFKDNAHVTSVGELLIGTKEIGVIEYNLEDNSRKIITKKDDSFITQKSIHNLYSTDDRNFYIGTNNNIIHFDRETLITKEYPLPDWLKDRIHDFHVRSIYKGKYDRIWMGTSLGLFLINTDSGIYTHFEHNSQIKTSISDNSINYIIKDSMGNMWVTTHNGLNKISSEQLLQTPIQQINFESFKADGKPGSIASNRLTVLKESEGKLFIGSTSGLLAFDYEEKRFIDYNQYGLKTWILGIETTDSGDLWCSTKEGLVRFNPNTLQFNVFGNQEGLKDITFRQGSSSTDQEGNLYFCSEHGVVKVNPDKIKENTKTPSVYVTSVKKMNPNGETMHSILNKETLELAHNDYYLSINFTALNYNQPEKSKYAYMLEGFDESWVYTNSANPIVYTNLDPGKYSFRIKAANNDGLWNEEGATLQINKQPAFWQTKWFYALLILGIASLIGLIFLFYSKYLHKHYRAIEEYNAKLNNEIEERKKVEKVLQSKNVELSRSNHDLEQFAYIASHDLQAPLRTIKSFAGLLEKSMPAKMNDREKEFMGYITKSVVNMQELVNDLLTFSRVNTQKREIKPVNLPKLMDNILLELDTTLKEADAKVQLVDFPESIEADKIKLKQLLQNLISNGIKFSKEGVSPVVEVSCKENNDCWQFEVKDNGIGISKEFNDKIFQLFQRLHTSSEYDGTGIGLALCKKIVEQHDGEIYVDSEIGKGSNFVFTISRMLN